MRRSSVANLNPSLRSFYLFSRRSLLYHIFWNNLKFVCMAGEPPSKRSKKEIAETSENGDDNILATYMAKRQNVCESVADFKFDKKRVRLITSNADMSETCKGIAYWMWREQRVQGTKYFFDNLPIIHVTIRKKKALVLNQVKKSIELML